MREELLQYSGAVDGAAMLFFSGPWHVTGTDQTASVRGVVTDHTGGVIPGTTGVVTNAVRGLLVADRSKNSW